MSAGLAPSEPQRVIAVVGNAGVGKSSLIERLKSRLGWQSIGIDEARANGRDWPHLLRDIARLEKPTLVESVLLTGQYRWVLARHDSKMLLVTCEEPVRLERVAKMPWATRVPFVQDFRWREMRTVDTTAGVGVTEVDQIARWCAA